MWFASVFLVLLNVFLCIYIQSVICGESQQDQISAGSLSGRNEKNNPAAERVEIPDLNVPLKGLFEDQITPAKPIIVESKHKKKMRRLKETGKLERYRENQRVKLREYYSQLSPAEKKLKYDRNRIAKIKRMKKNPELIEALKKAQKGYDIRYKARECAKKQGNEIKPEDAKMKRGRHRIPTSRSDTDAQSHQKG